MTVNEFLQKYRRPRGGGMVYVRPRVKCRDKYTVSVQAGYGLYSTPCCDADEYTHVELGFPSGMDSMIEAYSDGAGVYAYVPVELADRLFDSHGGIIGADFSNDTARIWSTQEGEHS